MENEIQKRQNSEINIFRLAAQRQLYNEAAICDVVLILITVVSPLFFSVLQIVVGEVTWIKTVSYIVSLIVLIISFFITSVGKKQKEMAASIQQEFDIDVFQMPWDNKLFGERKNLNFEIANASKKYLKSENRKNELFNWYSIKGDFIPKNEAIAFCQKENFNWDAGLRKRYRLLAILFVFLVSIAMIIMALIKGQTVLELLKSFILVIPLFKYLGEIIYKICCDLKRMETIERALYTTKKKNMKELMVTQKEIYNNRKNSIIVPNWFYKIYKDNDEDLARRTHELEMVTMKEIVTTISNN